MKHYIRRLRKALRNKNYYQYYYEDDVPLVWELDGYIIRMVRANLPNYEFGYPLGSTQEKRDKVKNEMIDLANKLYEGEKLRFGVIGKEEKVGYSMKDMKKYRERFAKLLGENLYHLRD